MDVDYKAEVRPFLTEDNLIGAGSFGKVYKLTYRGRKAAVKVRVLGTWEQQEVGPVMRWFGSLIGLLWGPRAKLLR